MRAMLPQTKTRLLFYLVFTCFGLFHAEVLSRSQPWVLLNPLWFLLVAPVYGVHYVVLGDLLLRRRATGFFPVFIAGCILGMYEFVITKMFWNPTWSPYAPRVMEVAWLEVFWIGFWWHAFMSFAIPFLLVRKLVLEQHSHPFQIKEVRYILVGAPVISATFGVAFGSPPLELLASILLSMVVLFAVARFFLRRAPLWGFKGPDDVLLGPTGRRRAMGALALVYIFYGATMRPDAWPSVVGFVLPALLYAVLFLMFYPFVRGDRVPIVAPPAPLAIPVAATPSRAPVAAIDPLRPPSAPMPPPIASAALPPGPLPTDGLRRFLVRYAISFIVFVALFEGLALAAPWALFILSVLIILSGGVGAPVLLMAAGGRSLKKWAARRGASTAA
jgi:hypothetical protein